MVAQLFRLRLALLGNIFLGTRTRVFGVTVGLLASLVAVIAVCVRVIRLGDATANAQTARTDVVIAGSVIVLAFAVVPLILQRADPVDPRRFALFGIQPRTLAIALVVSSFAALPVVAVSLFGLSSIVTWAHSPLDALLAVVGAALGVATCVLFGRISSSLAAFLLSTRRAREIAGVIGVLILVLLAPAVVLALSLNWGEPGDTIGQNIAAFVSLTPLGAAWGVPAAAANGDVGGTFLSFIIAVVTVVVLWLAWRALVTMMLQSNRVDDDSAEPAGLGWFARLPSTPTGSIAARSLTYWSRDPRYYVPLIIVPVVPIIMAIPFMLVAFPVTTYALIPLPVMCLFLGFMIHNDIALDSSAVWLHIVSGRRGLADRLGRMAPVFLIGLPLIGVGSVITVFLAANSAALPSVLGVSTCLLLTIVGLGSVISARFPYAATRPGDSPFVQPQSTGSTSVFVQLGTVLGTLVLSAPSIVFAIQAEAGDSGAHWSALWCGVGTGVVVLILGALAGGAVVNRRGPEILASSLRS
ncbi:ABC transporter permease [Subtercola lobariae]|uniref:Transporter n=1 Tax=Subtercola lobariae TaxID=1588641 RepID=A0A917B5W4_9MICO|nr:ABC transporter permease [Subtercola lobariae]GGF26421.1 transporter [Subtercola lobariae]